jgi:hypothetical protein
MWINNTFVKVRCDNGEWRVERGRGFFFPQKYIQQGIVSEVDMDESASHRHAITNREQKTYVTEDHHLTNAAKIGTALLVTNAKRSLIFV